MDVTIISTYRCDSKCSMCYIWKNPTLPEEEVMLKTLEKLPNNIDNCNISGGEPTLRKDLMEMVDILATKSRIMEISTNGLHYEKIIPIVKKYPNIKIRFSLEGFEKTNNTIRGEEDGFKVKVEGVKKLIEAGGKDLGFGAVIQDTNLDELVELYRFCKKLGIEFATSALHNAFQFHKNDNYPYDRFKVAKKVEDLIVEQLKSWSIKNWFRAYLNLGLIEKILGHDRLIPCIAGSGFTFVDPWSDVYACNVRPDLLMGNLEKQTWGEIWEGEKSIEIRKKVAACTQNCWMVTTARTAMRNPKFTFLPKNKVMFWVVLNKVNTILNRELRIEKYIDYNRVLKDQNVIDRKSYLGVPAKRNITKKSDEHYIHIGDFFNR